MNATGEGGLLGGNPTGSDPRPLFDHGYVLVYLWLWRGQGLIQGASSAEGAFGGYGPSLRVENPSKPEVEPVDQRLLVEYSTNTKRKD